MTKPKKVTKRRNGQSASKAMLGKEDGRKHPANCGIWPRCACIMRGNAKRDCGHWSEGSSTKDIYDHTSCA